MGKVGGARVHKNPFYTPRCHIHTPTDSAASSASRETSANAVPARNDESNAVTADRTRPTCVRKRASCERSNVASAIMWEASEGVGMGRGKSWRALPESVRGMRRRRLDSRMRMSAGLACTSRGRVAKAGSPALRPLGSACTAALHENRSPWSVRLTNHKR